MFWGPFIPPRYFRWAAGALALLAFLGALACFGGFWVALGR